MHPPSRLAGLAELSEVRMLWFSGWYDGPVTGLAVHDGREYWFVTVLNEGGETWDFEPRVYILHRLTANQLAAEWERHRSGAANDLPGCLHSPPCPAASRADRDELAAFYERWPPDAEDVYMTCPAVGWFRDTTS